MVAGRPPKDPDQRRRRNKISTAAALDPDARPARAPSLPRSLFADGPHPSVRRWWRVIWRSPMATRWLPADVEGLYMIATLRDLFARKPSTTLAAEIRQQEARYGLDVFARKRLDWRIGGAPTVPAAGRDGDPVPGASPVPVDDVDPRGGLRAVV